MQKQIQETSEQKRELWVEERETQNMTDFRAWVVGSISSVLAVSDVQERDKMRLLSLWYNQALHKARTEYRK